MQTFATTLIYLDINEFALVNKYSLLVVKVM